MSNQVTGMCQEVKTKTTKIGPMYDLVVNGKAYGVGKYPPKCKAGDNVTFDIAWRGEYPNVDTKTLVVVPGTGAPPMASSGPAYTDNKQEVISRQSALNSAIAWMQVITGSAGIKDKAAADEAMVKYRNGFYKASTGKDWAEGKETAVAAPAPAPAIEPVPEVATEWS